MRQKKPSRSRTDRRIEASLSPPCRIRIRGAFGKRIRSPLPSDFCLQDLAPVMSTSNDGIRTFHPRKLRCCHAANLETQKHFLDLRSFLGVPLPDHQDALRGGDAVRPMLASLARVPHPCPRLPLPQQLQVHQHRLLRHPLAGHEQQLHQPVHLRHLQRKSFMPFSRKINYALCFLSRRSSNVSFGSAPTAGGARAAASSEEGTGAEEAAEGWRGTAPPCS